MSTFHKKNFRPTHPKSMLCRGHGGPIIKNLTNITVPKLLPTDRNIHINRLVTKRKISDLGNGIAEEIYALLNVYPESDDDIRIVDEETTENSKILLLHYLTPDDHVSRVRGTVVRIKYSMGNVNTIKVVAMSFPHTEEITIDDRKKHNTLKDMFDKDTDFTKAYEGTILRVFNVDEKWYVSTHKKLDACSSRWLGCLTDKDETFGSQFYNLWGDISFDDVLDKDKCYVFLISHPSNRLVCKITEPILRLVAVYVPYLGGTMTRINPNTISFTHPNVIVQSPLKIDTIEELEEYVSNMKTDECTGILICTKNECIKIVTKDYLLLRSIRGNEPNIKIRYIQLKVSKSTHLTAFKNMYPEYTEIFDNIDVMYSKLPQYLSDCYVKRYIDHTEYVRFSQEIYRCITYSYNNYSSDHTLLENILYAIENTEPRYILNMLEEMLSNRSDSSS